MDPLVPWAGFDCVNAMGFEEDIFISYAHLDNERPGSEETGWIASFHKDLEIRVGQLVGKTPKIWRDPKLSGNDFFADTLVEKLPKVATLVCIVSPTYVQSEWCTRELHEFWEAAHGGHLPKSKKARVFKVVKTSIGRDRQPEELQALLGYEFFKKDPETDRILELDTYVDPGLKGDYWARINDLAHDLAEQLESIGSEQGGNGQGEAGTVYLSETMTSDLKDERDRVRRDLIHHVVGLGGPWRSRTPRPSGCACPC